MSNEVRTTVGLTIRKGNLVKTYQDSYVSDMTTAKGPTPGALTVGINGEEISLAELSTPGWCRMTNLDSTNFVEVGIRDPQTNVFYPLIELQPGGKPQIIYLTRYLLEQYEGTGTGTSAPENQLWAKADTAECVIVVEAFER